MKLQTAPPVIQKPPSPPAGPPPAPMPTRPKHAVADRLTASELLFRIVICMFLAGSLFLAWWSFAFVLAKPLKESRELSAKLTQLSREVDEMDRLWSSEQVAALDKKFAQALGMFLNEDLDSWGSNLSDHAKKLNLTLAGGVASANAISNLGIGKVNVNLEVTPDSVTDLETSYQRLLRLCQHLATPGTRCDMPELDVSGGSNSVSRATMVLNLWSNQPAAKP